MARNLDPISEALLRGFTNWRTWDLQPAREDALRRFSEYGGIRHEYMKKVLGEGKASKAKGDTDTAKRRGRWGRPCRVRGG